SGEADRNIGERVAAWHGSPPAGSTIERDPIAPWDDHPRAAEVVVILARTAWGRQRRLSKAAISAVCSGGIMPVQHDKIAIVGAGSVGATVAYACLIRGVAKQ